MQQIDVPLTNGSLLIMEGFTQADWQVGIDNIMTFLGEPVCEKTNNLGSDLVRHKAGCTVTEIGQRLVILDLESRGIVLSMWRKQR